MIINHHYTINYRPTNDFLFRFDNGHVSYQGYEITFNKTALDLASIDLKNDPTTRQTVLVNSLGFMGDSNACLVYVQLQIVEERLVLIANFRSQSHRYGRPTDDKLLNYIATSILKNLGNIKHADILVNVGNYHDNS